MGTMAGKSSPALFELIREQTVTHPKGLPVVSPVEVGVPAARAGHDRQPTPLAVEAAAAPRPVAPVVRKPEEPARPLAPAPHPELKPRPAATAEAPLQTNPTTQPRWRWGQPLVISPSVLLIVGAVGLVLLIGAFVAGFRSGFVKGDGRATRELSLAATTPTDPLLSIPGPGRTQAGPSSVTPGTGAPRPTPPPVTQPPAVAPEAGNGVRAVLSPPEADPRQAGLNYYAIVGQLDRDSAQQIAAFLAENGVASVAVDTSSRGSNNPRSYRVYGLQGMTGAELRSPARTEYEQRISQLGVIWKRDHRGWTDFSQTNWERYQP
jgi:hypothetical protein